MISTKAIVLSSIKFQETSIIVKCYTLEGVRSYLLKGILKPKKNGLKIALFEPLTQLEIIATNKNDGTLNYIKEAKIDYFYQNLHQNFIKNAVIFFLAEICHMALNEETKNEHLYFFIQKNLQWFDQTNSFSNFHLKFLIDLTKYLGVMPNTLHIENLYLDLEDGHFVNENNGHLLLNKEDTDVVKFFLTHDLEDSVSIKLNRTQRNNLLDQLLKYYLWHLPNFKIPKSWEVLRIIL